MTTTPSADEPSYQLIPLLPEDHLTYVIRLFAKERSYNEIKALYLEFWGKPIAPEVVMSIERDYADRIGAERSLEQRDIARKYLAHSANRLDKIEQGLNEAWKERQIGSFRGTGMDGKDCWVPEMGKDLNNYRGFLDLARKEEELQKRLYLDAIKLDIEASQVRKHTIINVDTGDLE